MDVFFHVRFRSSTGSQASEYTYFPNSFNAFSLITLIDITEYSGESDDVKTAGIDPFKSILKQPGRIPDVRQRVRNSWI
jgi:hypothetical protein